MTVNTRKSRTGKELAERQALEATSMSPVRGSLVSSAFTREIRIASFDDSRL